MLHNGNEAVGTDSRVNLYSDSILSSSPEFLNLEVLLEPLEEQFYLPTIFVEVGNLQSSQFLRIGQEHELTALVLIEESYKPKMLRIAFQAAIDGQLYLCIGQYPLGQPTSSLDAPVLQIGLSPDNKERLRTMYAIEFLEIVVATVEDVVSTCLNGDFLHRLGVMH